MLGFAAIWETFAPDDELLSHAADDSRARWPIATRAAIIFTALHLLRALPPKLDPFCGPPVSWFRVGPKRPIRKGADDGRYRTNAQAPERPRSN